MRCIAKGSYGKNATANQFRGECINPLIKVQKLDPREYLQTFGCLRGFALAGFVEHELGGEKLEFARVSSCRANCKRFREGRET